MTNYSPPYYLGTRYVLIGNTNAEYLNLAFLMLVILDALIVLVDEVCQNSVQ